MMKQLYIFTFYLCKHFDWYGKWEKGEIVGDCNDILNFLENFLAAPQIFIPRETLYTFDIPVICGFCLTVLTTGKSKESSISIYGQIKYYHGSRATNMWFQPYLKEMVLTNTVILPLTDEDGRFQISNTGSQPTEIYSQWGQRPQ